MHMQVRINNGLSYQSYKDVQKERNTHANIHTYIHK